LKYNTGTLFISVPVLKNPRMVEMLPGHFLKVYRYVLKVYWYVLKVYWYVEQKSKVYWNVLKVY
jgi:hypothetical protein